MYKCTSSVQLKPIISVSIPTDYIAQFFKVTDKEASLWKMSDRYAVLINIVSSSEAYGSQTLYVRAAGQRAVYE